MHGKQGTALQRPLEPHLQPTTSRTQCFQTWHVPRHSTKGRPHLSLLQISQFWPCLALRKTECVLDAWIYVRYRWPCGQHWKDWWWNRHRGGSQHCATGNSTGDSRLHVLLPNVHLGWHRGSSWSHLFGKDLFLRGLHAQEWRRRLACCQSISSKLWCYTLLSLSKEFLANTLDSFDTQVVVAFTTRTCSAPVPLLFARRGGAPSSSWQRTQPLKGA